MMMMVMMRMKMMRTLKIAMRPILQLCDTPIVIGLQLFKAFGRQFIHRFGATGWNSWPALLHGKEPTSHSTVGGRNAVINLEAAPQVLIAHALILPMMILMMMILMVMMMILRIMMMMMKMMTMMKVLMMMMLLMKIVDDMILMMMMIMVRLVAADDPGIAALGTIRHGREALPSF